MKRIVAPAVLACSWWVVFTGGISHALDERVAGPYYYEYECDQEARYLNARGRTPGGAPLVDGQHYFCEWFRE
jgi:hypothetical protein